MIVGYEYEPFIKLKDTMKTGDEIYIVTRRRNRKEMLKELKKLGKFYHKLLSFNSNEEFDTHDVIRHKKKVIYYYQMKKFFEDNAKEAKDLKSLCPTCDIVLVNVRDCYK